VGSSRPPIIEDVVQMKDSIRAFHDELSGLIGGRLVPVPPGSKAASELAINPDFLEPLHTAYGQGIFLIESAADHLMLFAKALDEPAQTLGIWTCARGVLEASAFSTWLLDPTINAELRLGRSFGRRLQGLREQEKLGQSTGEAKMADHAKGRQDKAEDQATRIGITPVKPLGSTDIIKQMLGEGELYRLLSGIAHGHHWALLEFGYGSAEKIEVEGLNVAGKQIKPMFAIYAGQSSVRALSRAAWFLIRLYGLDLDRFGQIMDGFFHRIGADPKGDLFWRHGPRNEEAQ
jgi:hypothetical protein